MPVEVKAMSMPSLVALAARLLFRDWRGGELRVLALALAVAIASTVAVALFTERLETAIEREATRILAADRILRSADPVPAGVLEEAGTRGLALARTLNFVSMAFSGQASALVSVKAASDTYPLRGHLEIADAPFAAHRTVARGPALGEAWLEARALRALGLAVGDFVTLGEAELRIGAVLITEPDRGLGSMLDNAGPRLLMHIADVPATGVVQFGSRVNYRYLFAHPDPLALEAFGDWLARAHSGQYELRDVRTQSRVVAEALDRSARFLHLGAGLAVLLAGLAIALAARRYSVRHYDYVAILKTLGAGSRRIGTLYGLIVLMLAALATLVGCALGALVHHGLLAVLDPLLAIELPPPGLRAYLIGALTCLACLLFFALPPLLALHATPPLRVLHKELGEARAEWMPYAFGALGAILLVFASSGDPGLTILVIMGLALAGLVLAGIAWAFLQGGAVLGTGAGHAWSLALSGLRRRRSSNLLQVSVFALALMALLVLAILRTDLMDDWRAQWPKSAPNHFMTNVAKDDIPAIEAFFLRHGLEGQAFYPLLSARLTAINGSPPDPQGPFFWSDRMRRDPRANSGDASTALRHRRITWTPELPGANRVLAGRWWGSDALAGEVSIEHEYATWLGIEVGDVLEFEASRRRIEARVSSVRSVTWETMQPNFFLIFSPGTFEGFGATYLSAFRMSPSQKPLLDAFTRAFPTVVVIEVDALVAQVRSVIRQVSLAIEMIFALVLGAGLLVLLACIQASLDERFREHAVLRTLGAGRRLIQASLVIEFAWLGLAAGVLAALGAEAAVYYLQTQVLEQGFRAHAWVWVTGPVLGVAVIAGLGLASTRGLLQTHPLALLQRLA